METQTTTMPTPDLDPLIGHIIGFIDSDEKLEQIQRELWKAGIPQSKILVFRGEQGLRLMDQLRPEISSDDEKDVLNACVDELRFGQIGLAVEVENHDEARLVSDIAASAHARHFTYFGPWFTWFIS